jgi:hypothetical protein
VRLWSVQSYRNGAYVFEATVCLQEIDDGEGLVVRVHPAYGYDPRPAAAPVVTSIDEPKTVGMVSAAAKESIPPARVAATPERDHVSAPGRCCAQGGGAARVHSAHRIRLASEFRTGRAMRLADFREPKRRVFTDADVL